MANSRFKQIIDIANKHLTNEGLSNNFIDKVINDFEAGVFEIDSEFVEKIKVGLKQIYLNSNRKELIYKWLDSVLVISAEDYDFKIATFEEQQIKCNLKQGIMLLLSNLNIMESYNVFESNKLQQEFEIIKEMMGENIYAFMYMDFIEKINYSSMLNKGQLFNLILTSSAPAVIAYKTYHDNSLKELIKIDPGKRVYIYSDSSYSQLEKNIKSIINGEGLARIIEYPNMHLLIV
jgi:hypothetical protein